MSDAFDIDLDQALETAKRAAQSAAAIIRDGYEAHRRGGNVGVRIKADQSPVTEVDEAAERVIREIILADFPDHAIYGEEQGRSGEGDWLWLVDPLDGTKSFVRGQPMLSTQIALMHRDRLLLGVSSAPVLGELAWARRGGGAFLDGQSIRMAACDDIADAAVSTGNLKSLAAGTCWNVLGEIAREANRLRGYGDFFHYHLLARGALDAVIESDVNILDIAALAVIIEEAGGVFTDLDGRALDLDTRSVLAAGPALHAQLQPRFVDWRS
ncbi:MAG: inositol monophosphatase family protein [Lysobacteraceae bacterium]